MTVTFLPVDTMRGSRMKFLQVKPITHVMRSLSSVSGLNVTATGPVRFLQLYERVVLRPPACVRRLRPGVGCAYAAGGASERGHEDGGDRAVERT